MPKNKYFVVVKEFIDSLGYPIKEDSILFYLGSLDNDFYDVLYYDNDKKGAYQIQAPKNSLKLISPTDIEKEKRKIFEKTKNQTKKGIKFKSTPDRELKDTKERKDFLIEVMRSLNVDVEGRPEDISLEDYIHDDFTNE